MTDQTTQGANSQQASGQSSSSSSGQSQSGQSAQGAQGAGSQTGHQEHQTTQQGQGTQGSAPQRPAYVLESEWDSTAGRVNDEAFGKRVSELAAFRAEHDIRKNSLPAAPDKYEIKLPVDFKAPEGVNFQFDENSADLKRAREVAHARGIDQETFSDMLGVYAATKIGEQQTFANARNAELAKLGSAAQNRIDAIETWLKARTGTKAETIVAQLKNYPHAGMVEMFEEVIRQFSHQGSAPFSQSGRSTPEPTDGKIAGYDGMTFEQKRAAQDQARGHTIPQRRAAMGGR